MGCFGSKVETEDRFICTNNPEHNTKYPDNTVVNSKYTVFTFLPKILWAHLRRFMNMYFFIIAILQLWSAVTPVNPITTWAPIVIIFAVAFVREGYDDIQQHKHDKVTNERLYNIIRSEREKTIQSQYILPGDILILNRNMEAPCDICLLYSSNADGKCCVETANLDGETNLKEKITVKQTQEMGPEGLRTSKIYIRCAAPNADLNSFDSSLFVNNPDGECIPINSEQFIQQGVFLRNVDKIYGLVCYTGKQTKLGLNAQAPPIKWTEIEKILNKVSLGIFVAQLILALITGSIGNSWKKHHKESEPYLCLKEDHPIGEKFDWIVLYIRCYLLTSIMIPVSLKVTIDICKYVYAMFIRNDRKMVYINKNDHTIQQCLVNNTSVIEDLGAIQYVFTDKTGTLTENEMKLTKIAIGSRYYGHNGQSEDILEDTTLTEAIQSQDHEVLSAICNLALCHTIKIIDTANGIVFEGVSPEEISFHEALQKIGIIVRQNKDETTISSEKLNFEPFKFRTLEVLPFSFTRRRMSVIVENTVTNTKVLFMKGAHENVVEHTGGSYSGFDSQVDTFSSLGLRVMALSMKQLTDQEYNQYKEEILAARQNHDNRIAECEKVYDKYEQGQKLIGITGIEDSLQDGVPLTIEMLRDAGIKVWMVTGDLMNTAVKIARSTRLISNDGEIIKLSTDAAGTDSRTLLQKVSEYVDTINHPFYLVIEGSAYCTNEFLGPLQKEFAQLASRARSVVCARTMPKQKAFYVEALKSLGCVTCAVGDGGNDVTMLRSAHIGIGIIGKEGRQAAVAADFAISQFSYIQRLILIHGRYSAYRTSWLTQFCFYKSILLALIQVGYLTMNGYSGSSYMNDFNLMCYNAIFTILPVIFFMFDKDVEESTIYLHPFVYTDSRKRMFINARTVFWWIIRSIYQVIVICVIAFNAFDVEHINSLDGSAANLAESQQIVYSSLILIVVVTTTIDTQNWTSLNFIFIWGNWVIYLLAAVCANMINDFSITREMYLVMLRTMADPLAWFTVVTITGVATIPVLFVQALFATYLPTRSQSLRFNEIIVQCEYKPVYLVDLTAKENQFVVSNLYAAPPETIWDQSHNIFAPILALFGCWK